MLVPSLHTTLDAMTEASTTSLAVGAEDQVAFPSVDPIGTYRDGMLSGQETIGASLSEEKVVKVK